jgi:hypothetical protein
MATARAPIKTSITRSVSEAERYTDGSSPPERFSGRLGVTAERRASTMTLRHAGSPMSELGFWVGTCLGRFVDLGPMTHGRAGGAKTRLSTLPPSCLPNIPGGTVFHFVVDGINAALTRATEAAKGQDVQIGGGVETIRQYLRAALIDEMHLAISPVLLGSGEHLLTGIDTLKLGYQCTEHVATANATHVVLTRRG